jgi:ketosteroid isomerase-like protein
MSERNVQTLRDLFDAFARGDMETWDGLVDPNVEFIPIGDWPEAEIRGREAVRDFLVAVEEPWDRGFYELSEIIEGGDCVVARMTRTLRGKSSGIEVDYDYWSVATFREGRMLRAQWFPDREEAVKAAGMSA